MIFYYGLHWKHIYLICLYQLCITTIKKFKFSPYNGTEKHVINTYKYQDLTVLSLYLSSPLNQLNVIWSRWYPLWYSPPQLPDGISWKDLIFLKDKKDHFGIHCICIYILMWSNLSGVGILSSYENHEWSLSTKSCRGDRWKKCDDVLTHSTPS